MARIDAHRVSLLILELTVGCTEGHRLLLSLLMIGLNSVVLWLLGFSCLKTFALDFDFSFNENGFFWPKRIVTKSPQSFADLQKLKGFVR